AMTEQELRSAISSSRKEGYRILFQQYYPYVYRIVWNQIRVVGSKEDAEECVSDVFSDLFTHFDEAEEWALQGFIGMLARRRAIDLFRRLSGLEPTLSIEEDVVREMVSDACTEETVETVQRHEVLYQHIRSLGEPDATMILMKYFYDCTSKEIADKIHMNPITVRVRMNRALKKLKRILSGDPFFQERGEPK
ncbi:MAG: sigma-70 family RNA polymerase sigma factor, partial [Oscillospiraceae bacterium]|nr:sigma-70 family RNA polymerase sigma factor [Oscillospiraceae bacterium]